MTRMLDRVFDTFFRDGPEGRAYYPPFGDGVGYVVDTATERALRDALARQLLAIFAVYFVIVALAPDQSWIGLVLIGVLLFAFGAANSRLYASCAAAEFSRDIISRLANVVPRRAVMILVALSAILTAICLSAVVVPWGPVGLSWKQNLVGAALFGNCLFHAVRMFRAKHQR